MWRRRFVRMVRLLAAVGLALLVVIVPSTSAWAVHSPSPVPSLEPGQSVAASGWTCHGANLSTTGQTTNDCQVSGWVVTGRPATLLTPSPHPTSVDVSNFPAVQPVSFPTPVPVREVSTKPPATSTAVITCGPGSSGSPTTAGSSPEPSPPADGSTPSPSPSSSPAAVPCSFLASLERGQAFGLWLFLGALVMLGVFAMIRREGRGFRG